MQTTICNVCFSWLEHYVLDFHSFTWNFKFSFFLMTEWYFIVYDVSFHYPFINWWISRIDYYALVRDGQVSLQQDVESFGFMSKNDIAVWYKCKGLALLLLRVLILALLQISIFVCKNQYQYLQKIQLIFWENTEKMLIS